MGIHFSIDRNTVEEFAFDIQQLAAILSGGGRAVPSFEPVGAEADPAIVGDAASPAAATVEAPPAPPTRTRRSKEQIAADKAAEEAAKAATAQQFEAPKEEADGGKLTAAEAEKVLGKTALVSAPTTKQPEAEDDPLGDAVEDEAGPLATYEHISELFLSIRKHPKLGVPDMHKLCALFGITKVKDLPDAQFGAMAKAAQAVLDKAG